jgi:hypothetical protein
VAPLPTRFAGDSYAATLDAQIKALGAANGNRPLPEMPAPLRGGFVPQLSNGQAVALIQSWRRAAARGRVTWPLWVDLEAYALGQRVEGDRFDMSRSHRQAALPDDALALLWSSLAQLAIDLDDSSTVLRPVEVAWTDAAYEQGARDTWEAIKEHARKLPPPPTPPRAPVPEIPKEAPPGFGDIIDVIADPFRPVKTAATDVLVIVALMLAGYYVVTHK